jgi:hypothetical protein
MAAVIGRIIRPPGIRRLSRPLLKVSLASNRPRSGSKEALTWDGCQRLDHGGVLQVGRRLDLFGIKPPPIDQVHHSLLVARDW